MSAPATNDAAAMPLNHVEPHDAAEQIIRHAIDLAASDLFILSDEGSTSVTVRVAGQVEPAAVVLRDQGRHLINFFKTMGQMDIGEHRRPQEGRWIFESQGERVDLRINVVPTLFGEDLAIRILDH